MAQVRVNNFSVSLDGYGAGPNQSEQDPIGVGGMRLHEWMFATRAFSEYEDMGGTGEGVDDLSVRYGDYRVGATIMGRNMFSPRRGPWSPRDPWRGWWGEDPPFRHPVFVLTHHRREPVEMANGTTFHFVTGGIYEALERAREAAGDLDIRIGGGVATIQQYLRAGLIDRLHLAIVPILLGRGERLLDGFDTVPGYECVAVSSAGTVAHVQLVRSTSEE